MPETLINEQAAVAMILESFPDREDLDLDHEREYRTFFDLEEAAKDCGDTLFLWIVREVKEGANERLPEDRTQPMLYTVESIVRVLERGRDDLSAVIRAFDGI